MGIKMLLFSHIDFIVSSMISFIFKFLQRINFPEVPGNVILVLHTMNEQIQDKILVDFKDLDRGILNPSDDNKNQQQGFCTTVTLI